MRSDPAIWLANQFYTKLVGKVLPARWFGVIPPAQADLGVPQGRMQLEIVSHCWQYAHLLTFQLSSLVNYPPSNVDVTYTLYYADEDAITHELVRKFDALKVAGLSWQWCRIPKAQLFRRAIGRHRSAKSTKADWVWFSDCDLIFHQGCLDSLAASLRGLRKGLVYPASEKITAMLPSDHPMISDTLGGDLLVDIDTTLFSKNQITKAKGAFQIVHGDVARAAGYCGSLGLYQQPDTRWRKTYEDTVFRNLIGFEGQSVNVDSLYRIRHAVKGRYRQKSMVSKLRGKIRRITD